jgi:hypothetical protein
VSGYDLKVDLCYPYRDLGVMALLNMTNPSHCPNDPRQPNPVSFQWLIQTGNALTTEARF